jgi:hypothetical protein
MKYFLYFILNLSLYTFAIVRPVLWPDNTYLKNLSVLFFLYLLFIVAMTLISGMTYLVLYDFKKVENANYDKIKKHVSSIRGFKTVLNFILNLIFCIGCAITGQWWFFFVMVSFILLVYLHHLRINKIMKYIKDNNIAEYR